VNALARWLSPFSHLLGFGWARSLSTLLRLFKRRPRDHRESDRDRKRSPLPCVPINRPEFLRPDPLIYSQYFLMQHGLAVTWDNPDIVLMKGGAVVSSESLDPATEYEIVGRIWNASPSCPVVSMPVYFSFLSFGVGTISHAIGKTHVNLGVKGGPGCPAFASMTWRTPATPGHYCIQVLLAPPDDLNFDNNLGQENTNVGTAHSPAEFDFQLRNPTELEQLFRFRADAYQLPEPEPCGRPRPQRPRRRGRIGLKGQGFAARPELNEARIARHRLADQPLPTGWTVDISPAEPTLAPDEEITVHVRVEPPADFHGSRAVNVNAFHANGFASGVTLRVVRS
jgi:hypothetical protein